MATFQELLAKQQQEGKQRKRATYDEHRLQCSEVSYIRSAHPSLARVFFAVPNGGKRTSAQTSWMHAEGMVNGVSDMILLRPNSLHGYLCIENKTPKGKQRGDQILFQQAVEQNGGLYVIVRSLDQFIQVINQYLNGEI